MKVFLNKSSESVTCMPSFIRQKSLSNLNSILIYLISYLEIFKQIQKKIIDLYYITRRPNFLNRFRISGNTENYAFIDEPFPLWYTDV